MLNAFLETIRRCLFPFNKQIHAKLYKLLLYRPGDHFNAPHQDTALGPDHVGTLVVCLPTYLASHGSTHDNDDEGRSRERRGIQEESQDDTWQNGNDP